MTTAETYVVRLDVLRKGRSIESCHFEGDDIETTPHFGLLLSQGLVGNISLFNKINPMFSEKNQCQIRGMAVLENQRKKDFGKALIVYCEEECKTVSGRFLRKMRYQRIGFPFEIPDVGEHILMFKKN